MKKQFRCLFVFIVAICMLGAGLISAQAAEAPALQVTATDTQQSSGPKSLLNVNGTSTISVTPDIATLNFGVIIEDKDASNAQSQVNTKLNSIVKQLTDMGIKKSDMTTQQISIYPMYDYTEGKQNLRGYQATQMINVRLTNLDNVGRVLDAAIKAGANQVYNVTFSLRDRATAYSEALEKAINDAESKAKIMAKASGKTISSIVSISENNSYYYSEYPAAAYAQNVSGNSNDSATSTLPGTVNVTANVIITYELK